MLPLLQIFVLLDFWRTQQFEYLENLLNLAETGEEGTSHGHLSENTSQRPYLYLVVVKLVAEEQLGCLIPES